MADKSKPNFLDKVFKLKEKNTSVKTEMLAGLTIFLTMAYILAVNPQILSESGMDGTAVLIATCLTSFIACACMGLMSNMPFALSAGMGINAFFAYTVCGTLGYSWQVALFAVFIEGIIFIILSLTNVREAIFNAIPMSLKHGVSVGIGLYIAFIGLKGAGIVVADELTLIKITNFTENFSTAGISAVLGFVGILITAFLYIKKYKASIFLGIIITWMLGIFFQLVGVYKPDGENYFSLYPSFAITDFSKLKLTFGQAFNLDFKGVGILNFLTVIFSFLFVDLFDTLGTIIGISAKAGMLDKNGKLPQIRPVLLADAIGTTAGAILGTSTVTTFVESSTGVAAGGRTGLTAITTGILFLIAMLFAPIFTSIPAFATTPALVVVGYLMFTNIANIKLGDKDILDALPAYICIIAMPLFYSISEGISLGIISLSPMTTVTSTITYYPMKASGLR